MKPQDSFVGQPIRSLQSMLRMISEHDPSHPTLVPDGIYGPETVQAISVFQRKHGLPVTGITDLDTWEAVVSVYEPARIERDEAHPLHIILNPSQKVRKGERHPHLYLVQGMLAAMAELCGSIPAPSQSGILDEATTEALMAFQALSALPVTGHLDKHTWKQLTLQYPLMANLQSFPR